MMGSSKNILKQKACVVRKKMSSFFGSDFFKSSALSITLSLVMAAFFEFFGMMYRNLMNGAKTFENAIINNSDKNGFHNFIGALLVSFCLTLLIWGIDCILKSFSLEKHGKSSKFFSLVVLVIYLVSMFLYSLEKAIHTGFQNYGNFEITVFAVLDFLLYTFLITYFVKILNKPSTEKLSPSERDDGKVTG